MNWIRKRLDSFCDSAIKVFVFSTLSTMGIGGTILSVSKSTLFQTCQLVTSYPIAVIVIILGLDSLVVYIILRHMALKNKFDNGIKELKKDFRLYLKPVGDTGFSIDTRDGKPVCPQCAGNGTKSQIRCQIRFDTKNLSEYTEIECSYKPTEHRCRLEGNPFGLETSRAFWRDCHSTKARKTHDLLFGLSGEKQRNDND